MKIIVTGGAGFIGSNLVKTLITKEHTVKIIDNLSTGSLSNIINVKEKTAFIKGNICNLSLLNKEFKNFDYVMHLAALVSVSKSVNIPRKCHDINATGTLNVLQAARLNKIKKVIFMSSCAVYGSISGKISENTPTGPKSPYAATKLMGEQYCQLFAALYHVPTIILRSFNVYGPNQKNDSAYGAVIPSFIKQLTAGRRPTIFGDGKQTRDFIYIDDIIRAFLLALRAPAKYDGQIFNIGSGQSTSINQLLLTVKQELNLPKIKPLIKHERPGDIKKSLANIKKAERLLKFYPKISLPDGIKKYIQTIRHP